MRRFGSVVKIVWSNLLSPTSRKLFFLCLWALIVLGILVCFKYVFLTSCVNVGNIKECVSSAIDSSGTLFAVGSVFVAIIALVPTFWIDSKIRDAKKEVGQVIAEEVRGDMQHLSNAQMLVFEADRYNSPAALRIKEDNIQRSVALWPAFKGEEYRKLGNAYSGAVMDAFYQGLGVITTNTIIAQTLSVHRSELSYYISRAIFYLEATVLPTENADRDGLVRLACMYGCNGRYDEMIRMIERAFKVDENAIDDFQESKRLSLLVRACGVDRRKIERLSKKIEVKLPLPIAELTEYLKDFYNQQRGPSADFFAIARQSNSKGLVYIVRITSYSNDDNGMKVSGQVFRELSGEEDMQYIPPLDNRPPSDRLLPVADFFEEVNKQLLVICNKEA